MIIYDKLNTESAYYFLNNQIQESKNEAKAPKYDLELIREDFPILQKRRHRPLVWFDNAATTQKPATVMETIDHYYREYNSNVHRGSHTLAKRSTAAYEKARQKVQQFIGAASSEEIIFLRGTTEAINLVAQTHGRMKLSPGDEILLTTMEHHSNIVPWQLITESTGAIIRPIPINDQGEIILTEYEKMLSARTKIVALTQVSNVLGTINPIKMMIEMAHHYGATVLIDGAQAVPHFPVNVSELNADFYAFSGHKLYGPTGIGVLYGKKALLEEMPVWHGGGNMIKKVDFEKTIYKELPYKFEAGTGNIADAIGLGAAIDYLQQVGLGNIEQHEQELTLYCSKALAQIPGLRLIGTAPAKTSVLSFVINGMTADDLAHYLDGEGIAIRSGGHCAQPLLKRYGLESTARVSLGLYNTKAEVDQLIEVINKRLRRYY